LSEYQNPAAFTQLMGALPKLPQGNRQGGDQDRKGCIKKQMVQAGVIPRISLPGA
jgi:hypothetical protein